ncbi:MAG TPA: phage major capsid protein [Candidatus Cryosericum sp.]|nr:phage major capsid protein [Candidatus Cryosericum sp.]
MEAEVMKQEVIKGVVEQLKAENAFATRDDIKEIVHNETMDVLKDVKPVLPTEFDANTPSQKRMVEEDVCKWYSTVLGERKAWDGVTTHVGLEMVPSLVSGRIVEKLDNTPFRKLVTHFPGDKGTVIVENTLQTALRMGAARAATAEGTPAAAEVTYSTYGGTAWLLVSNKLIRNASMAIVNYIENSLVRSIDRLHTYEWTLGSGTRSMTGMFTGATALDSAAGIDTLAELTLADTMAAFFNLEPQYADNAVWLFPNTVVGKLAALNKADTPLIDIKEKTLMGRPYIVLPSTCFESPADTKAWGYFGDMSYYYLFEEKPVSIVVSDVGKTLVTADQTVIAGQFETDGKVVLAEAIQKNLYNTA